MNHDATHCLDYKKDKRPKSCYRTQLTEELKRWQNLVSIPMSWAHFGNTEVCPMRSENNVTNDPEKTEKNVARPEYRTMYGFDLEELRKLALILRELEIEPHELKHFMSDMGLVYTKCMEHAFRQIQKTFDEVFI